MYNVKVKEYGKEQDIIIYENPVMTGFKPDKETIEKRVKSRKNPLKSLRQKDVDNFVQTLKRSMRRTKQKVYDYARSNEWEWFVTWTFDKQKVNSRYDYDELSKRMSQWLKDARKMKANDMKYLIVPEHHEDGAIHFHGLMSDVGELKFESSGVSDKSGREIFNVGDYKLGFTTATKISDSMKASNYITKYITVEMIFNTKNKKRYWVSRNLDKPEESTVLVDHDIKSDLIKMYEKDAKNAKKIEVERSDFKQEIIYITI